VREPLRSLRFAENPAYLREFHLESLKRLLLLVVLKIDTAFLRKKAGERQFWQGLMGSTVNHSMIHQI